MLRSIFTLCFIGVFASFAVANAYAAMLLYWWFGTFKPQEWIWWDISSLRLPLMAALLFLVHAVAAGRLPRLDNTIAKLMAALLGLLVMAEITAGCEGHRIVDLSYVAILVLMVLLSERLLTSLKAVVGLLLIVCGSLGFYSGKAGVNAALSGKSLYGMTTEGGSFSTSNGMALATAMMLFFLFFLVQVLGSARGGPARPGPFEHPLVRRAIAWVVILTICGSAYFVVATQSRGSALSLGIGVLLYLWLQRRRFRMLLLAALVGLTVLAVAPLPEGYEERLASVFAEDEERDRSAASRPHFWRMATLMASDHAFGIGAGCYHSYYNVYDTSGGAYGQFRSVHSSHFSVLAEAGYGGLAVWLLLLLVTYVNLWKLRAASRPFVDSSDEAWSFFHLSNALIASQTVFVIGGSFYEVGYNDFTWLTFGMTIALSRQVREVSFAHPARDGTDRADEKSARAEPSSLGARRLGRGLPR